VPVFRLDDRLIFPAPHHAEPNGLIAVGGDLRPERLLLAYRSGIFPWYEDGLPILWHSPDPRCVLLPEELHVPRSLQKQLRRGVYDVRFDTCFVDVMRRCGEVSRPNQKGTWITDEMLDAYVELHRRGYAHSAESFVDGRLVGGLYGVCLGHVFFGESMFSEEPDASKVAFVVLVEHLMRLGVTLIDCQVRTDHLARFGAVMWQRRRFLTELAARVDAPTPMGPWRPSGGAAA
jgi:leucyl/phenylalanyl-tRNA---protein transferase